MKIILFFFIFLNSFANAQRRQNTVTEETVFKGDSLELAFSNDSILSVISDTVYNYPFFDGDSYWRYREVTNYYFDRSNNLKKIYFTGFRSWTYYLYFEGNYLRKVRLFKAGLRMNVQYYYSDMDNRYLLSEIDERSATDPDTKELYEFLKIGTNYFNAFRNRLDKGKK